MLFYLCHLLHFYSLTTNRYLNYKQSVSNLIMKPGVRKGVQQFKELQAILTRPAVQEHMDRLQEGSPTTLPPGVYERHKERRERSVESSQRIRTLSSARSPLKPAGVRSVTIFRKSLQHEVMESYITKTLEHRYNSQILRFFQSVDAEDSEKFFKYVARTPSQRTLVIESVFTP